MSTEGNRISATKPATARVFFALWPPAGLADSLGRVARDAAARFGGRATRPDSIHLTLAFLGNVPEMRLPALLATAAQVHGAAFALRLDQLDYWQRQQLLWAGCAKPTVSLSTLFSGLRQALDRAGFTAGRAGESYAPHVSLVRRVPAAALPACPLRLDELDWPCSQFVLVRSHPAAAGSDYRIIAEFPLTGDPGSTSDAHG